VSLMRSTFRLVAILLAVVAVAIVAPGLAAADSFVAGAPGVGDPFFPLAGNGGYDVSHYSLRLDYDPATHQLDGTATISATATQDLSSFDLDLRGFEILELLVNGQSASFTRNGQELVITPRPRLQADESFTVVVDYSGVPAVVTDPR
jgi:aminopeptidase N